MFRKWMFMALSALFLMLMPEAGQAQNGAAYERVLASGKIRCGYFVWPPYFIKDANTGALSGLNYDYMMEIGKVTGLEIEWAEETTPGSAMTGLDAGRYDVLCASVWPDESRLKNALLTDPTFYSTVYAAVRKDDKRFDNGKAPLNAKDVRVIALDGDVTHFLAKEKFPQAKIDALPQLSDGSHLFQSVATGKADVTLADRGVLADFNRSSGDALKVVEGLPPVGLFAECLAVGKGEIAFKMMLDTAIRTINDQGKPAEFIGRYPGYEFFAPLPGWSNPEAVD